MLDIAALPSLFDLQQETDRDSNVQTCSSFTPARTQLPFMAHVACQVLIANPSLPVPLTQGTGPELQFCSRKLAVTLPGWEQSTAQRMNLCVT